MQFDRSAKPSGIYGMTKAQHKHPLAGTLDGHGPLRHDGSKRLHALCWLVSAPADTDDVYKAMKFSVNLFFEKKFGSDINIKHSGRNASQVQIGAGNELAEQFEFLMLKL
jgi:hypothetical protein